MIHVRALGTAEIDVDGVKVTPASTRKFAMLLYLAADAGRRVSRSALHELIFPDQSEKNARHSLRQMTYQLRRDGVNVVSDPDRLGLIAADVAWDIEHLASRDVLAASNLAEVRQGILPGYWPSHSEAFAEWLERTRARLTSGLVKELLKHVAHGRQNCDWLSVERSADACLALDPLNEEATLAFAEALALGGSKAKAIALLDRYILDVGKSNAELRLPAAVMRRRIGDQTASHLKPLARTPFVGRSTVLTRLRDIVGESRAGLPSCVVLSGDPGMGKSRLAREFSELATLDGLAVCHASMQPNDKFHPLGAFAQLVPKLLELPGALGCSADSLRLLERLVRAPLDPTAYDASRIDDVSNALTLALCDLLDAVATERSLALILDDAQFADSASIQTLAIALSTRATLPVMVLLTTRSPRSLLSALRDLRRLTPIQLGPLSDSATSELVDHVLAGMATSALPDHRDEIVRVAAGNPLFAVALASRSRTSNQKLELPPSITDLLVRSIDGISTRALGVLAVIIALGKHCTVTRLARCLGAEMIALLEHIGDLSDAGLVSAANDLIQPAHPLIVEVFQQRLPAATRRLANVKVAEVLETEAAETLSPAMLWDATECWIASQDWMRAFGALRACAEHAISIGRVADAARTLERASSLNVPRAERISCLLELVRVADIAIEHELVLQATKSLRKAGYQMNHDDVELAEFRALVASFAADESVGRHLIACLSAQSSSEHRIDAALTLLKFADIVGNAELINHAKLAVDATEARSIEELARLEFELIYSSIVGDVSRVVAVAEAIDVATTMLSGGKRRRYLRNASTALIRIGKTERAIRLLEDIYHEAGQDRSIREQATLATYIASILSDCGHPSEYDDWCQIADEMSRRLPGSYRPPELCVLLLDTAISAGDFEQAHRLYQDAIAVGFFEKGPLTRRWERVIRMRLKIEGTEVSVADLSEAVSIANDGSHSMAGIRDAEVACGCAALLKAAKIAEAEALVANYLTFQRKDARVVSRTLQVVIGQIERLRQSVPGSPGPSTDSLNTRYRIAKLG